MFYFQSYRKKSNKRKRVFSDVINELPVDCPAHPASDKDGDCD